jgi:hypothetical protein
MKLLMTLGATAGLALLAAVPAAQAADWSIGIGIGPGVEVVAPAYVPPPPRYYRPAPPPVYVVSPGYYDGYAPPPRYVAYPDCYRYDCREYERHRGWHHHHHHDEDDDD